MTRHWTWQRLLQKRIVCGVANYDENILQQYADDLYRQAKWITVWTALRYGLAVFSVSFGVGIALGSQKQISADSVNSVITLVLFLTLIGIGAGVDAGRRKSFHLKLHA